MMTVGMMRDSAYALKETRTQSSVTGSMKTTYEQLGIFRFFRQTHKEQTALLGKEEAQRGSMILQCRRGLMTEEMTHYTYDGKRYRIDSKILDTSHQVYDITATLVNQ